MKSKKKIAVIIAILLIAIFLFYLFYPKKEIYELKNNKIIYKNIEHSPYKILSTTYNNTIKIQKIKFRSRPFLNYPTTIYSLVYFPNSSKKLPAILYLPAGAATKESREKISLFLANQGYIVMTIDQRGIGETGGYYLDPNHDYVIFAKGKEPIQHLSVYDALKSLQILSTLPNVDKNKLAVFGISMGGRYGLIASSLTNKIKGFLGISTSGFNIQPSNQIGNNYLLSIDPDSYVADISPKKFILIQIKNDSVVSLNSAKTTFSKAKQPKKFYLIDNSSCSHGYCPAMNNAIKESLNWIFS